MKKPNPFWKALKKYRVPIGLFLIAEGVGSMLMFSDQLWIWQVGRLIRVGIGLVILA